MKNGPILLPAKDSPATRDWLLPLLLLSGLITALLTLLRVSMGPINIKLVLMQSRFLVLLGQGGALIYIAKLPYPALAHILLLFLYAYRQEDQICRSILDPERAACPPKLVERRWERVEGQVPFQRRGFASAWALLFWSAFWLALFILQFLGLADCYAGDVNNVVYLGWCVKASLVLFLLQWIFRRAFIQAHAYRQVRKEDRDTRALVTEILRSPWDGLTALMGKVFGGLVAPPVQSGDVRPDPVQAKQEGRLEAAERTAPAPAPENSEETSPAKLENDHAVTPETNDDVDKRILEIVGQTENVKMSDLVSTLGLPASTLRYRLNKLVESGNIQKYGERKWTYYAKKRGEANDEK